MVAAISEVEARRRTRIGTPPEQLRAEQRYAFAYDPSTIAELEAVVCGRIAGRRAMSDRRDQIAATRALSRAGFDVDSMSTLLAADVTRWQLRLADVNTMRRAVGPLAGTLQDLPGDRLVDRWNAFERNVWPQWIAGHNRPPLSRLWTWGVWAAVGSRAVQPGWPVLSIARVSQWVARLPVDDPLLASMLRLREASDGLRWGSATFRAAAVTTGTRLLLACGPR